MAYYTQEQIEKAREMDRADRKPTLEKKKRGQCTAHIQCRPVLSVRI